MQKRKPKEHLGVKKMEFQPLKLYVLLNLKGQ